MDACHKPEFFQRKAGVWSGKRQGVCHWWLKWTHGTQYSRNIRWNYKHLEFCTIHAAVPLQLWNWGNQWMHLCCWGLWRSQEPEKCWNVWSCDKRVEKSCTHEHWKKQLVRGSFGWQAICRWGLQWMDMFQYCGMLWPWRKSLVFDSTNEDCPPRCWYCSPSRQVVRDRWLWWDKLP